MSPWSRASHDDQKIGEIWYERSSTAATDSLLLLKLLFTSEPLSIQVHPDDRFAHAIGLARGKSEVWYVLSAAPGAQVALGLSQHLSPHQLREAIGDGSISSLVDWRTVFSGDVILVPAGTIHAIGAGVVIAELQQRSDATFRLFDHGRQRELHIESAIAVASTGPADVPVQPKQLTNERTILVSSPHFVLEKIDLPPNSVWRIGVERETWFLILGGGARVGSFDVTAGDAVFAESDRVDIRTGPAGMVGLVAHPGIGPAPDMLQLFGAPHDREAKAPLAVPLPTSATPAKVGIEAGFMEAPR